SSRSSPRCASAASPCRCAPPRATRRRPSSRWPTRSAPTSSWSAPGGAGARASCCWAAWPGPWPARRRARRSSSPPAAPEWDQGPTTRGPSSLGTGTRGPAAPRAARPPWVPMETLTPSSQSTAGNGHQTNGATGEAPPGRTARRGIAESGGVWFGAVLAVVALVFAAVALVFDGDGGGGGGAAAAADTVTLELTEFALEPSSLTVPAGAGIEVVNNGSVPHNVSIEGTDIMTSDLAAGESETLDISSLEPGTYEILCTIAGHADAGMTGTLTVTEGGTGASGLAAASGDDAGDGDHAMHGG